MPSLSGQHILITRPESQAQELASMIESEDGCAFVWPCIELVPAPTDMIREAFIELPEDALLIFVSPNAARMVWQALTAEQKLKLNRMQLFAVGEGTAKTLHNFGYQHVIYPDGKANSEALLALPELQAVADRLVIICRGQDGRELIAETLRQRGANIHYLSCYHRHPPQCDPQQLIEVWQARRFTLVILTSVDSLHNLEKMLGYQKYLLQQTPITVMSERMELAALKVGIQHVYHVDSARNIDLLAFIQKFASNHHK